MVTVPTTLVASALPARITIIVLFCEIISATVTLFNLTYSMSPEAQHKFSPTIVTFRQPHRGPLAGNTLARYPNALKNYIEEVVTLTRPVLIVVSTDSKARMITIADNSCRQAYQCDG